MPVLFHRGQPQIYIIPNCRSQLRNTGPGFLISQNPTCSPIGRKKLIVLSIIIWRTRNSASQREIVCEIKIIRIHRLRPFLLPIIGKTLKL